MLPTVPYYMQHWLLGTHLGLQLYPLYSCISHVQANHKVLSRLHITSPWWNHRWPVEKESDVVLPLKNQLTDDRMDGVWNYIYIPYCPYTSSIMFNLSRVFSTLKANSMSIFYLFRSCGSQKECSNTSFQTLKSKLIHNFITFGHA